MSTKFCRDCQRDLPLTEFTNNRRSKDGLAFYCKICARERHAASRRRRCGPAKTRNGQGPKNIEPGHKWCPECDAVLPLSAFSTNRGQRNGVDPYCKPCFNAIKQQNKSKIHGSVRNYHLRRRYGITVNDFDRMLAEQGGVCAICREAPAQHVDHDHATLRVRGLLCFNCNGALGQFRDRADLMLRAVHYLRQGAAVGPEQHPDAEVGIVLGVGGPHYVARWRRDATGRSTAAEAG